MTTLWHNAVLATMADAGERTIDDGVLAVDGQRLQWVGPARRLPHAIARAATASIDLGGALVTPGLIDAHTHLVYGGNRAAEFELRLRGASYEELTRAGAGIRSTVAATRAASDEALYAQAAARLVALMAEGVTTIEIKSGYGLTLEHESRLLALARRLGTSHDVGVCATFLGAHALPPEHEGCPDAYIDAVCAWLPQLHACGLVDAVDAFCDRPGVGFSPAQVRRVFEAARALRLPVKLHAEQLSNQQGAQLAAEFGALSCDHLEYLDEAGVRALANAGSVAVLLPGAFYYLRETHRPPVQALRDAGVPIAVASDHNPGSAPVLSLLATLNLACVLFGLTPWEALRGVTAHAARALGLAHSHGALTAGRRADFVAWDAGDPRDLVYYLGRNPCRRRVRGAAADRTTLVAAA